MTIHVPSAIVGFITLAFCLALTWLCNVAARQAVNKVLYREMQRLANLLPSVGLYILIDSMFVDSVQPGWLRVLIDIALATFALCVPFKGETAWYEKSTSYSTSIWFDNETPPTPYC